MDAHPATTSTLDNDTDSGFMIAFLCLCAHNSIKWIFSLYHHENARSVAVQFAAAKWSREQKQMRMRRRRVCTMCDERWGRERDRVIELLTGKAFVCQQNRNDVLMQRNWIISSQWIVNSLTVRRFAILPTHSCELRLVGFCFYFWFLSNTWALQCLSSVDHMRRHTLTLYDHIEYAESCLTQQSVRIGSRFGSIHSIQISDSIFCPKSHTRK